MKRVILFWLTSSKWLLLLLHKSWKLHIKIRIFFLGGGTLLLILNKFQREFPRFLVVTKQSVFAPSSPSSLLMLTVHQQQQWQRLLSIVMFSSNPHPSRNPCSFVAAHLCTQQDEEGGGTLLLQWALHGPMLAPTLMRCSCFQIQLLILILFLLFFPLQTLTPLLNLRSPRTPQTWWWSLI